MNSKIYERQLDLEDFLPESQFLISEYICKLCGGVLFEATFDSCDHMYCNKCIKKAIELKPSEKLHK